MCSDLTAGLVRNASPGVNKCLCGNLADSAGLRRSVEFIWRWLGLACFNGLGQPHCQDRFFLHAFRHAHAGDRNDRPLAGLWKVWALVGKIMTRGVQ